MAYSKETQRLLLRIQQSEMTEAAAYHAMASSIKDDHNRETLGKIADEIAAQAHALEKFTDVLPQPDNRKARRYARMARVFGFTFAAKLMDKRMSSVSATRRSSSTRCPKSRSSKPTSKIETKSSSTCSVKSAFRT